MGVASSARAETQGLNSLPATFALLEYLILPIPLFIAAIYAVADIGAPAWQRIALPTSFLAFSATLVLSLRYPNSPLFGVAMLVFLLLPIVASVVAFIWWSGYTSRRQSRRSSASSNPPLESK